RRRWRWWGARRCTCCGTPSRPSRPPPSCGCACWRTCRGSCATPPCEDEQVSVNGTVTALAGGGYEARVATSGAALVALTHRGRDLVLPFDPAVLPAGYQGRTLVPWPNRVVGGRYAVAGRTLRLPVNEPETGAALHGHGAFQPWTVV